MADAIVLPQNPPISLGSRFYRLVIPGVRASAINSKSTADVAQAASQLATIFVGQA